MDTRSKTKSTIKRRRSTKISDKKSSELSSSKKRSASSSKKYILKPKIIPKIENELEDIDEMDDDSDDENDTPKEDDFETFMIKRTQISKTFPASSSSREEKKCVMSSSNKGLIIRSHDNIIITKYVSSGVSSHVFTAYDIVTRKTLILKFAILSLSEIQIMKISSKFIKYNKTPHVVSLYDNLDCSEIQENDIISTEYIIDGAKNYYLQDFKDKLLEVRRFLQDNKYSLLIMELFDGDMYSFLHNQLNILTKKWQFTQEVIDSLILSAKTIIRAVYSQIYIALLTFHKCLKYYHNDVKFDNFFYKKINHNANEFLRYKIFGKDIYVINLGYIIVLGDYGTSSAIGYTPIEKDLINEYLTLNHNTILPILFESETKIITDKKIAEYYSVTTEKNLFEHLFKHTKDMFFSEEQLPSGYKLINSTVYKIPLDDAMHAGSKIKRSKNNKNNKK